MGASGLLSVRMTFRERQIETKCLMKKTAVYGNLSTAEQWQRFSVSWPWLDCFLSDTESLCFLGELRLTDLFAWSSYSFSLHQPWTRRMVRLCCWHASG